jgi:hypothetical protein
VSRQSRNLLHAWVFPYIYLIKRVPMSWYDFVCCFWEHKVTHLWTCVDVVYWLKAMSVPEADAPVSGASSCGQQAVLVWVPSNSFYSCLMLTELCQGIISVHVPYHKLIIIASACKLLSIERPLKAANLLFMSSMSMSDAIACSQISAENHSVSGPRADSWAVPRNSTDPA